MKNLSKILAALMCVVLVFAFAACSKDDGIESSRGKTTTQQSGTKPTNANTSDTSDTSDKTEPDDTTAPTNTSSDPHYVENQTKFDTTKHVFVTFVVKDMGEFQVELYPEYAPNTVTNFVNLADSGYFNGTKFHRVVDDFMAQGGDNQEVDVDPIYGEFASNGFSQNTLKHERGVISMARTTAPDSATGQFFICYADASFLDGNYAAFGRVTYGMDVIDSFLDVERGLNSSGELATPLEDIVIVSTTVSQNGK